MAFIISVYGGGDSVSYKEFILPSINNSDYSLILEKGHFHLKRNCEVLMEVMEHEWRFKNCDDYYFEGCADNESIILRDQLTQVIKLKSDNTKLFLFVKKTESVVHSFEKFVLNPMVNEIRIGRADDNDIVYSIGTGGMNWVPKYHGVLRRAGIGYVYENPGRNPAYINGEKISINESRPLKYGDSINIIGLHIVFLGNVIAIDRENKGIISINQNAFERFDINNQILHTPVAVQNDPESDIFYRSPRKYEHLDEDVVEIEGPPELPPERDRGLFAEIGPSLTMALPMIMGCALMMSSRTSGSGLYMYSGLIMAVSSALIGTFWSLSNYKSNKKERKATEEKRFRIYSNYLLEQKESISEKYEETKRILNEKYPSAMECLSYDANGNKLWNRNRIHKDFFMVRLGMGNRPFQTDIVIPKKRLWMYEDELRDNPELIKKTFEVVDNIPITVDIEKEHQIGIVGGYQKKGALEIVKILCAQIAANVCYTDIKFAFVYDENIELEKTTLDFAKWLPHVWSEDHKNRYIASKKEEMHDVFYNLANIMRQREANEEDSKKSREPITHYVLFVTDYRYLEGEALSKYLFDKDKNYGTTVIFLAERNADLPNSCEYIIQNDEFFQGIYHISDREHEKVKVDFDQVFMESLEQFTDNITSVRVRGVGGGGEIPDSLTFFDMYRVNRPEELPVKEWWAKNKIYENIRGLLGQKVGGADCVLDVHEKFHGPHGLVAGTTGSGKSETLQTYILSLALAYSPDDIGFFIIDYKGGGLANMFDGLPHMIGAISNLSGTQVHRAMISIKSENRRRQRIFAENGVNNINAYTKLYKSGETREPVPHMFIVIDEFAEMKKEEPEFMKELISVAQVGRSLGVHLILATQKPSGTVDDNIWSNAKFRLCLRVQDRQDSMDMLHRTDAAYITQAGRGFMQVGNDEIYEQFQSGYSGAIYEESIAEYSTDIVHLLKADGTVEISGNTVKTQLKNKVQYIWIDKILSCIDKAMREEEMDLTACLQDPAYLTYALTSFYEMFEREDVEYPENDNNTKRLVNLLQLYEEVKGVSSRLSPINRILELKTERNIRIPEAKEKTQLDAVKTYLGNCAREFGYRPMRQLWLPVIPGQIYLEDLRQVDSKVKEAGEVKMRTAAEMGRTWSVPIIIGQFDDPANQSQPVFVLDLAQAENIGIFGTIACGKSTLVQTILYSLITNYSPEILEIYGIDFSNKMMDAFRDAPHVKGLYFENDADHISELISQLDYMLEKRKEILSGGSFSQYVQKNGMKLPAILVVIDNMSALNQRTQERYVDDLIRLAKEGVNYGFYMIITGGGFGSSDIPSQFNDSLKTQLCLSLQDRYVYGDLLHDMRIEILPEPGIKGRGLAKYEKRILEYQVGLAIEAENDFVRMDLIRQKCQEINEEWQPMADILSQNQGISWEEFSQRDDVIRENAKTENLTIGLCVTDDRPYSIPLKDTICYMISGEPASGKTNTMKVCIEAALAKDAEVVITDNKETAKYKEYDGRENVTYVTNGEELFDFLEPDFTTEFVRRNRMKKAMLEEGEDNDAIFAELSMERPIFIFIHDMDEFVDYVYAAVVADEEGGRRRLPVILESFMLKGMYHNIYFFTEIANKDYINDDDILMNAMESHRTGLHLGGFVEKNARLDFEYMKVNERIQREEAGVAILCDTHHAIQGTKKVFIPKM